MAPGQQKEWKHRREQAPRRGGTTLAINHPLLDSRSRRFNAITLISLLDLVVSGDDQPDAQGSCAAVKREKVNLGRKLPCELRRRDAPVVVVVIYARACVCVCVFVVRSS